MAPPERFGPSDNDVVSHAAIAAVVMPFAEAAQVVVTESDPQRRVHRELRRHAMRAGHEVVRALYQWYTILNRRLFDWRLGNPLILIGSTGRSDGTFTAIDDHGLASRITISPRMLDEELHIAVAVLLHQMVRAWCVEVEPALGQSDVAYGGHGPGFCAKANEIGAKLGFPHVQPKARGGARPEGWPYIEPIESPTVYFVQRGHSGAIYIGATRALETRLRELRHGSEVPLIMLHAMPGSFADERNLRLRFAEYQVHAGWFSPQPALLEYISSLGPGGSR